MKTLPYRRRPCVECPFRVDVAPGMFETCRYEALEETAGRPGKEAPIGAPLFACHKSPEGKEEACAGWLASIGMEHLGVRVMISRGQLDPDVLTPGDDWPELHKSYDEMREAKQR